MPCFARIVVGPGLLTLIGLLIAPGAAAFDCDSPSRPVEVRVCQNDTLAALDRRVDRLAARLTENGTHAPLARDQANWASETRAEGWAAIDRSRSIETALAPRYRRRLAYLQARQTDDDAAAETIATRIAQQLSTGPVPTMGQSPATTWPADSTIRSATNGPATRYDTAAKAFEAIGLTPADTRLSGVTTHDADRSVRLRWLAAARLGMIHGSGASARGCADGQWFTADEDGEARPVAAPFSAPTDPAADGSVTLVRAADQPVALCTRDPSINERRVMLRRWHAGQWQPAGTIVQRFDHGLGRPLVVHRQDSGAQFWRDLARPIARAFDRRPEPGFTRSALSPRNRARVTGMRQQVLDAAGGSSGARAPLTSGDGVGDIGDYDAFDSAAVFFPTAVQGNWLLGRIGQAHAEHGTRPDWLLGFWTRDADDTLVPLAAIRVPRTRQTRLGQAILAEDTPRDPSTPAGRQ